MTDAVLIDWPDVADQRPKVKVDTFQSSPYKYAVNFNRHLYMNTKESDEVVSRAKAAIAAVAEKVDAVARSNSTVPLNART